SHELEPVSADEADRRARLAGPARGGQAEAIAIARNGRRMYHRCLLTNDQGIEQSKNGSEQLTRSREPEAVTVGNDLKAGRQLDGILAIAMIAVRGHHPVQ